MENAAYPFPLRLNTRKTPIQARSEATVAAIQEAAIQVLLADGLARLTTTRVAERAGVSVGTLYQYFPNKEALLFAILQRHFEEMAEALERICETSVRRPLSELADRIADAYVSVKLVRPDATRALYRVAGAIDQFRLSTSVFQRMETAVIRLLGTASDASFNDPARTAFTLLSALAGLSRSSFGGLVLGSGALDRLPDEARLLSRSYLEGSADVDPSAFPAAGNTAHVESTS